MTTTPVSEGRSRQEKILMAAPNEEERPLCTCGTHAPEPMYRKGRGWRCAVKQRELSARWRAANPDRVRELKARWRAANSDQVRENYARGRANRRAQVADELERRGGGCVRCKRSASLVLIEWHHRDPATKVFKIAEARHYGAAKVEAELAKCDPLCEQCHNLTHWEMRLAERAA